MWLLQPSHSRRCPHGSLISNHCFLECPYMASQRLNLRVYYAMRPRCKRFWNRETSLAFIVLLYGFWASLILFTLTPSGALFGRAWRIFLGRQADPSPTLLNFNILPPPASCYAWIARPLPASVCLWAGLLTAGNFLSWLFCHLHPVHCFLGALSSQLDSFDSMPRGPSHLPMPLTSMMTHM